ncbi:TPA: cation:dicarboxylase symporter family transporter [Acinetobacter baumannii]
MDFNTLDQETVQKKQKFHQILYVQVIFAIILGILIGHFYPELGESLKPLGDAFIKIVKMIIAPVIFLTVVTGIASMTNMSRVGRVTGKAVLFVLIILGAVARYNGFSIIDLIRYIKDELWLVLGTSSSEAALPSLMDKMQKAGCEKSVVGLVIPTGYSFNLDGTNIYMTMAALFIAQACNVDLSIGEQVALLLVAMVSSKGAAGVTGAGFITLAATLSVVPAVPVAGMALILGIDRFMSECRALTNLIGNACATIVVARWDKALDKDVLDKALRKSKTN